MYKPLADSTLMNMTKKEIIEHLRIAEHNHKVCEEQIEQQYKNCKKLLKEERANTLEETQSKMTSFHTDMIFEYGADIIEARADAFSKLKEWIEEQIE